MRFQGFFDEFPLEKFTFLLENFLLLAAFFKNLDRRKDLIAAETGPFSLENISKKAEMLIMRTEFQQILEEKMGLDRTEEVSSGAIFDDTPMMASLLGTLKPTQFSWKTSAKAYATAAKAKFSAAAKASETKPGSADFLTVSAVITPQPEPRVGVKHSMNPAQTVAYQWILKFDSALPADFNHAELKKTFRALALKLHPDQGGSVADFLILRKQVAALHPLFNGPTK